MNIMWNLKNTANGNDLFYVSNNVAHTEDENMDGDSLLKEDEEGV